ncbi:class I SAM-dependent methyltransferase [Inquilinus limosus]|uniref:class I SAM-dependent methyltransferase n=1 Tax=Inquilinus limosus TaxID=171674 RepID=UPI003F18F20A
MTSVAMDLVSPSLSEVINVRRHSDPEWSELHREIESYSVDKHVFLHTSGAVHRKGWEWTQAGYGLSKLGVLHSEARGLGVGAGREALIFWLADRVGHVTATDLYGNERWSAGGGAEASVEVVENTSRFCPRSFASDHVHFMNADGTALPFGDNTFDFCWSISSIEHFGSHEASAQSVCEMARVVRPGGIVCIATELLLLEEYSHEEFFTKSEAEKYVIGASSDLRLVDDMSWELPPAEYLIDQIVFIDEKVHRLRRHVVMNDGNVQWTSFMVFLRKNIDPI